MKDSNLRKVGGAIRRRREELGYSQEGFAQYALIERARFGRIERGEMNLTLESLFYIAAHLDLAPSELLADITVYDCMGAEKSSPEV